MGCKERRAKRETKERRESAVLKVSADLLVQYSA
jgi:hypothetical protein